MKYLGVAEYNYLESQATAALSYNIATKLVPKLTSSTVKVEHELQLEKFIEFEKSVSYQELFTRVLGKISTDEFDLIQKVYGSIADFTERWFKNVSVPITSVIRSLNAYRNIKLIYGDNKPKILELMPGCGVFGALCILDDLPYVSIETRQPFYIYQSQLFNFLSDGRVYETASDPLDQKALGVVGPQGILHIPWWRLIDTDISMFPKVDLISCNNELSNLSQEVLEMFIKLSFQLLNSSEEPFKCFIINGWGSEKIEDRVRITKVLIESGFVLAHHDPEIVVFCPLETRGARGPATLPSKKLGYHLIDNNGQAVAEPITVLDYNPPIYSSEKSPVSQCLSVGRSYSEEYRIIPFEQIDIILTLLFKTKEYQIIQENGALIQAIKPQVNSLH